MTRTQRRDIVKAFTYQTVYELYIQATNLPIANEWKQAAIALYGDNAFFHAKVKTKVAKLMKTIDGILIIEPDEYSK